MKEILKPDKYYQNIYKIDYQALKKSNIKYLIFDLDNTIADNRHKLPSNEAIELFQKLKKMGFITVIISNALPSRTRRFAEALKCEYYPLSSKPHKKNYLKYINKYNIDPNEMAAIGDQIYTDIKGAKRLGILGIFVDRISKYESIFTRPNRLKEKLFIYNKIIKKGEYYE